jgi:hypothetical protein
MAAMSLRPPRRPDAGFPLRAGVDELAVEIMAEKASALERAGRKAEQALAALAAVARDDPARRPLVRTAADALYGYLIQRELMGFRRHADVFGRLRPPPEVVAKLGAR